MRRKITLGRGVVSILRNGGTLLASHWTEAILRLVYAASITRILGAEEFGLWSYSIALYTLLIAIVSFGFETQLPLRLGTSRDSLRTIGRTGLVLRLGLLAFASFALVIFAFSTEPPGIARTAILVAIPAIVGRGLSLFARWVFVGLERTGFVLRISVAMRFLEVFVGLALLISGFGVLTLIAIHAAVWVADGLISLIVLQRSAQALSGRFDRQLARKLVIRGLPLGSAAGLKQWLTIGPILLIRNLSNDLALTGQFALALQIVAMAVTSVQPFFFASLPVLGRAAERGDQSARQFGPASAALSFLVFVILAVLAYWVGPPVAVWVFGPELALTGPLVAPLLAVGGLILVPTGYTQMLVTRSIHWPDVVASGLGAVILLVTMPSLLATWGIWGAVAATACAWFARAVAAIGMARRLL